MTPEINRSNPLVRLIAILLLILVIGFVIVRVFTLPIEIRQQTYSDTAAEVNTATINISAPIEALVVNALSPVSSNLFEASVESINEIDYQVSGREAKSVRLAEIGEVSIPWQATIFSGFNANQLNWTLNLNQYVPIDLQVSSGTGAAFLNLADVNLSHLDIRSGTGALNLVLPALESAYPVVINAGTGAVEIALEPQITLNLTINAGTGDTTINLPPNAEVQLTATIGTGAIELPSGLQRTGGDPITGIWQTANFANVAQPITIAFTGGTGRLTVR
ncbi:MAG: hypothetical protein MUF87_14855 [Anaerolineae bacterium]|jgi:hypothetical protein|nr:hypothetical protein [Anaerolineae bacterium]